MKNLNTQKGKLQKLQQKIVKKKINKFEQFTSDKMKSKFKGKEHVGTPHRPSPASLFPSRSNSALFSPLLCQRPASAPREKPGIDCLWGAGSLTC